MFCSHWGHQLTHQRKWIHSPGPQDWFRAYCWRRTHVVWVCGPIWCTPDCVPSCRVRQSRRGEFLSIIFISWNRRECCYICPLFQRCLVHVTFSPRMDPNMVRQEGVRMMEREAEAERKRQEQASPQEKLQEQPSGLVSGAVTCSVHAEKRWVTIVTLYITSFLSPIILSFLWSGFLHHSQWLEISWRSFLKLYALIWLHVLIYFW